MGSWGGPRPTARQLRRGGGQPLAFLGHRREDRLGHLTEDVELADLVRDRAEDRGDRLGIQRRTVGRDSLEGQTAGGERLMEVAEQRHDVLVGRVVVENVVGEPFEGAIVDDREDAEGSVIQLVDGKEAREVGECPVEMLGIDLSRRLFPPRPPPSSGWWANISVMAPFEAASDRRVKGKPP